MANPTVEILIKAKNATADEIKKANLDLAAMKIAAQDAEKEVTKLTKSYGLTRDVAEDVQRALDGSRGSMENARIAAMGLGQELGVHMPRAVSSFLGQSELIGPALSAAFSTVAVIGMIEVLGQIPRAFDKMVEALTGWDDKAKKAFDHVIEYNDKTVKELERLQSKLAEISGGAAAGAQVDLQNALRRAGADSRTAAALRNQATANSNSTPSMWEWFDPTKIGANILRLGMHDPRIGEAAQKYEEKSAQDAADVRKAKDDATIGNAEKRKKDADDAARELKRAQEQMKELTDQINEVVLNTTMRLNDKEKQAEDRMQEQTDRINEVVLGTTMHMNAEEARKQEALDRENERLGYEFDKALEQGYQEIAKKNEEFQKKFRDGAGKVWDDFRQKGFGAFADLANYIGKQLFEGLAMRLLFGSGGGGSDLGSPGVGGSFGGLTIGGGSGGGGLLSSVLGGAGILGKIFGGGGGSSSGIWSEAIPGIGGSSGGGILGRLFGGGGGLLSALGGIGGEGTAVTSSQAAVAASLGFDVGAPTGLGGALGLGGSAGILGLGAATIPVIGAAAAGIAFLMFDLLQHRKPAPFTRDPDTYQSRDFYFYSGAQALKDAATAITQTFGNITTQTPGILVSQGLPMALQSNQSLVQSTSTMLATGDS